VSNLYPRASLLWSLTSRGPATTLSAAGNSGAWSNANPNAMSAVDLRDVTDVTLMVTVGGVTGTPAFVVSLDVFDANGNPYLAVMSTASLAAAGAKTVSAGLHGASTAYLVLPSWGRISWTGLTSASVTGTEIELWGR
jgi:hypothetical protein